MKLPSWRQPLPPQRFAAVVGAVATVTGILTATIIGSGALGAGSQVAATPLVDVPSTATASATQSVETTMPPVVATTAIPVAAPVTTAPVDIAAGGATVVASNPVATAAPIWTRGGNSQCRCTVEFPWAPVATSTAIESGTSQLILAEHRGSPLSAAVWTAPAADGGATIDDLQALLTSVAGNEGTITDRIAGNRADGSPLLSATLRDGVGVSKVRVFSFGNIAYVMLMGASDGQLSSDNFDRFVNSFATV